MLEDIAENYRKFAEKMAKATDLVLRSLTGMACCVQGEKLGLVAQG